jgi:large repetitive protein
MKKSLQLLFLILFTNSAFAQFPMPNDCVRALNVCGNGVFTSNATGIGDFQEVLACGSSEHNSIWLKVTIAQGGTLGFDIKPLNSDLETDYDFWVYGPNATCSSLGTPIRCCTTNPVAAGLTDNVTGMNGSTSSTSAGPGAATSPAGDDYVRWLTVSLGQTYYIALDRSGGDGGFELHWTGTALITAAPVANAIDDYVVCSTTLDVGIFNLDSKRSQINSDLTNNSVNFFTTLANAVDNINPLQDIYINTSNPQTIYARVTDNATDCFSTTQFNLVVNSCMGIDDLFNDFKVVAYPNPFENDFFIDVASANQELLQIKVYDMLGKLVEQKIINPISMASQKMGQQYAAGVYNVIVTQEGKTNTFKIVKL